MKQLLCMLCALLLAACASAATALPTPSRPTATTSLVVAPPTSRPTTPIAATAALPRFVIQASPTPIPAPRVGVQVGHWRLDELPDELERFKVYSGTYYGGYDEWQMNLSIAEPLKARLEAAGVVVDLLPATVPIGYEADAFVSIHIDGVAGAQAERRHGYKIATPYRASPAALALAAAVGRSYPRVTGLPEDVEGPSFNMRAHYIFSPYRFWHSVAPTTPSIMVECGFATYASDRALIFEQPDLLAKGIAEGILAYLAERTPNTTAARAAVALPTLKPLLPGLPLREYPTSDSITQLTIEPEQRLIPLAERDNWYLVTMRGVWEVGWVPKSAVVALDEPQTPLTPHP